MFGLRRPQKEWGKERPVLRLMTKSHSFAYVEAYKALRTNLVYMTNSGDTPAKVIMITSAVPGEGKSNVSVNLAVSLAQDGKRVVLLDCDLRTGTLHRYLRLPRQEAGLSSILSTDQPIDHQLQESFYHFGKLGIDVLPAGYSPVNPSELLGSERMRAILNALTKNYDYVLCDSAPVNAVTDAVALGRYMDAAILVVSHNGVTKDAALMAKNQLESINLPILGTVLNRYVPEKSGNKEQGYTYYNYGSYGYGYGNRPQDLDGTEKDAPEQLTKK